MSRTLRSFVAGAVTSALLVCSAAPALADSMNSNNEESHTVPIVFDALFLRPLGLVLTAFGGAAFCVVAPLMAITRPTDIGKPFQSLVMAPVRYTWVDPLGYH